MIQTLFTILGYIVVILVLVLLIVTCFYGAAETFERRANRIRNQAYTHACYSIGQYIAAHEYWFSEDPIAAKAIEILGKAMNKNGLIDFEMVRSEWREFLKNNKRTHENFQLLTEEDVKTLYDGAEKNGTVETL